MPSDNVVWGICSPIRETLSPKPSTPGFFRASGLRVYGLGGFRVSGPVALGL